MSQSNVVLAYLYGRSASRAMRPLRVSEDGSIAGPALQNAVDWHAVSTTALAPLVPFTDYSQAAVVVLAFRVAAGSPGAAKFTVEASFDLVRPVKSFHYEYPLAQDEHDAFETPFPNAWRGLRLSVEPQTPGQRVDVEYAVFQIAR